VGLGMLAGGWVNEWVGDATGEEELGSDVRVTPVSVLTGEVHAASARHVNKAKEIDFSVLAELTLIPMMHTSDSMTREELRGIGRVKRDKSRMGVGVLDDDE